MGRRSRSLKKSLRRALLTWVWISSQSWVGSVRARSTNLLEDLAGLLQERGLLFFQGEAPGDEVRLGDDLAGHRVHRGVGDHQAVRGQVAAVPEHDAADVPHALAVHEDPAGVHPVLKGAAPGVEADLVAVGGQEDAVRREPPRPGPGGCA